MSHLYRSNKGFTLLEVMVAMAILALVLTGIMQIFSNSLIGIGKSELHTEGTLVARRILESYLLIPDIEEGVYTGIEGDYYQWTVGVRRRETAGDMQEAAVEEQQGALPIDWLDEESLVVLYEIAVEVSWNEASYPGRVKLVTMATRFDLKDEEQEGSES